MAAEVFAGGGTKLTFGAHTKLVGTKKTVFVSRVTASGSFSWLETLFPSTTYTGHHVLGIAVDSTGNSHVVGHAYYKSIVRAFVTKLNASGVSQWVATPAVTGGSLALRGDSIVVDSTGMSIFAGGMSPESMSTPGTAIFGADKLTPPPCSAAGRRPEEGCRAGPSRPEQATRAKLKRATVDLPGPMVLA